MANDFNMNAWNTAAAWNEEMWEKQAKFNAEQAELQRQFNHNEAEIARNWTAEMDNTKYARAMADMQKAGLNPILAYGGISSAPSGAVATGSAATVGGAQMSSAQSAMASGGLLQGNQASEGNYTGQMEYLGGMLGLLSAAFGGISSAIGALGNLGDFGEGLSKGLGELLTNRQEIMSGNQKSFMDYWNTGRQNQKNENYKPNYRNGIDWNMKNYSKIFH